MLRVRVLSAVITTLLITSIFVDFVPRVAGISVDVQGLMNNQEVPQSGVPLSFNFTVAIGPNEHVPFKEINIMLDSKIIRFNVTGSQIVSPGGMFDQAIPSIQLLEPFPNQLFTIPNYRNGYGIGFGNGFGYGYPTSYGYGYQNNSVAGFTGPLLLKYRVTIFPAQMTPGPHNLRVEFVTDLAPRSVFISPTVVFQVAGAGYVPGGGADFILSMSSTSFSMPPNSYRLRNMSVTSVNGFIGNVALNAHGPPDLSIRFNGNPSTTVSLASGETKVVPVNVSTATFSAPGIKFAGIDGQGNGINRNLGIQVNVAVSGVPTMITMPNYASPGASLTFTAFGFTPGNSMTLQLQLPSGLQTIVPTSYANNNPLVGGDGIWSATVTIPLNAQPGQFNAIVSDGSGKSASAPVNIVGAGNDFLVSVSPNIIDAPPGGPSAPAQVRIQSLNSFNSPVNLTIQGVPPGYLTASFAGGASSAVVTPPPGGEAPQVQIFVQASQQAAPGDYFITVRATSTNPNLMHMSSFTVHIPFQQGFFNQFSIGSISLSPSYGAVNSTITVSGSGFPQGASFNSIYLGMFGVEQDRIMLPSNVTVSQSGSFSTQFIVPSRMQGNYPVTVSAGGFQDMKDFRIVSGDASFQLSVSPPNLPPASPGGSITLNIAVNSLNGKSPTVDLYVRGLPSPTFTTTLGQASLKAPSGGSNSTTLSITVSPTAPPSPYSIDIEGRSGNEFQVIHVPFGVKPPEGFFTQFNLASVSLTPNYGAKNTTVTVQGSGFPTEQGTQIMGYRFGPVFRSFTTPVNVTNDGQFTAVIKVPNDPMIIDGGRYPVEFKSSGPNPRFAVNDFSILSSSGKYMLTVSPNFLPPVPQGGSATLTVSLTSINQQSPEVTLSVRGLPPKISYLINGSSTATVRLGQGQTQSVNLVLNVDPFAPPGPYPFEIRAVSGAEERSFQVGFGVMPQAQFGLANIILNPDIGARNSSVTISGSGFNNGAQINGVKLGPTMITFSTPVNVTGGAFTAVFTVPSNMPFGIHPLSVADTGMPPRSDIRMFNVISSSASFNIFASPPFIGPVMQGSSSTTTITVKSYNNKNPDVALSVDGLPPGVTASFDRSMPISVTAGQAVTTMLTLTVSSTVPPGHYGLSITGRSGPEVFNIPLGFGIMPNMGGELGGFASIIINPEFGRPGDQITVSGAGFTAGQAVTLAVRPPGAPMEVVISAGNITVQAGGDWSFTAKIPSEAMPGFYDMIARAGTREARAPLNIAPADAASFFTALSPQFLRVSQGQSSNTTLTVKSSNAFASNMTFSVEGLPPGLTVAFLRENGSKIGSYTGSAFGNVRLTPPIPIAPPSGGVLKVKVVINTSATLPRGSYPLFIKVNVMGGMASGAPLGIDVFAFGGTSLSINPGSGDAGKQVTVSGVGFGNSETITLRFAGNVLSNTVPSTITTGNDGSFSAMITIPSSFGPGFYPVQARGGTTNRVTSTPFQIFAKGNAFIFYASPPQVVISPGGSGNLSLTLTPLGNFNSNVTVAVLGLPPGATAQFVPALPIRPTVGTSSTTALTVTVPGGTAPGSYFLRLIAFGGSARIEITASVRVAPSASDPDFEVILNPPGIAMPQGGSNVIRVAIRSFSGFSSPVSLNTSTSTSGLTRTFQNSTITPSATTGFANINLTIAVDNSVQLGTYNILVTGTSGQKVRSNMFQLSVFPSGTAFTTFTPPAVLPDKVTPGSPLPINPPWGDRLRIDTLNTAVSQPTEITPKNIPRPPSEFAPLPDGFANALSRVTSFESNVNIEKVNASLSFPYNASELAALGISPGNLKIAYLADNGTWVAVNTKVNATAGRVSANITHFSSWTVLAETGFGVTANPSSLSIIKGSSDTSTVTVSSLNFNSAVALTVTGAPTGVTASLSPTSVTPPVNGTATSTLTVSVSTSAAVGTYTLTITGTSGDTTKTTTVTLVVKDFSVSASPSSITVAKSSSGTSTVTVSSLNLNSAVALTVTGAPSGVTTGFTSSSVTPSINGSAPSVLTVTVSSSATAGTYTLTVTGTSGSRTSSATITLNILASEASQISANTVLGGSPSAVDKMNTAGVKVALTGVTYTVGAQGTLSIAKYTTAPTVAVAVATQTGKTAVKYVDVLANNLASGTATVTVVYSDADVAGLNVNTLTLYYFSNTNTWVQLTNVAVNTGAHTISGDIDVTKLTGTIISLVGEAAAPGGGVIITPGPGIVVTTTTSTTKSSTSTTTTTTSSTSTATSTTVPTTTTITTTATKTNTATATSTRTATLSETTTATTTVTVGSTSVKTATATTTATQVVTSQVLSTAVTTTTATVTSQTTLTNTQTSTANPPAVTVTSAEPVGTPSDTTFAAFAAAIVALIALIAVALLIRRQQKQ